MKPDMKVFLNNSRWPMKSWRRLAGSRGQLAVNENYFNITRVHADEECSALAIM